MPTARFSNNGNYWLDSDSAVSSQNWGGNFSTIYYRTFVHKNAGSGYWGAEWWVRTNSNVGQVAYASGGSHDFRNGSNTGDWMYNEGHFNVGHDGEGYGGWWTSGAAYFNSIGSAGEANTGWRNLPRIPKKPSRPGRPQFTEQLPTSVRVSWSGSSDNRGSNIDGYLLRRWEGTSPTGSYVDSVENNTSRVVRGLTPGKWYTFAVYAHNGAADNNGFSDGSEPATVRMLSGGRIRVGGQYKTALPYERVDGTYKLVLPFVKSSGSWRNTS